MTSTRFLKWVLVIVSGYAQLSLANLPIEIQSDQASYFHQEGKMIHEGHVVVHWGDKTLLADRLILLKDRQGQVQTIKAFGTPATFEGTHNERLIEGQANRIEYHPNTQMVELHGDALLTHLQDKFMGPLITLNTSTSEITAHKNASERPVLIFHSKPGTAS